MFAFFICLCLPPALESLSARTEAMIARVIGMRYRAIPIVTGAGLAAVGIVLKFIRIDGLHVPTGALYITLGWMAIIVLPQIFRGLSAPEITLLLFGGFLYTAGAVVLARHWPDPRPSVFGYHEIWHSMGVAAGACHYALIFLLLLKIR